MERNSILLSIVKEEEKSSLAGKEYKAQEISIIIWTRPKTNLTDTMLQLKDGQKQCATGFAPLEWQDTAFRL